MLRKEQLAGPDLLQSAGSQSLDLEATPIWEPQVGHAAAAMAKRGHQRQGAPAVTTGGKGPSRGWKIDHDSATRAEPLQVLPIRPGSNQGMHPRYDHWMPGCPPKVLMLRTESRRHWPQLRWHRAVHHRAEQMIGLKNLHRHRDFRR